MGLTVAVVTLALADRGMDLFQISLLFTIYASTTMTLELPFGGLADGIGRKPVFLTAGVASLVSLTLFLSSHEFFVLALSFMFIGFGRAMRSGTLDAWYVEGFRQHAPGIDIQPALARAQFANSVGLALGAIFGGLLPDIAGSFAVRHGFSIYDTSYAASLIMMLAVLCYTVFAIREEPRPLDLRALRRGFESVPAVVKDAGFFVLRHRTLSILLAAMALLLMATNPVEVFWPPHVKSMLDDGYANTAIGLLTATYFFSIAFGATLSTWINRLVGRRPAVTLSFSFAALAFLQAVLALQVGIIAFVGVFILFSVVLGSTESPASTILHSCVEDHQRSTILSLLSLVQQLGAVFGLLLIGGIAESYSIGIAWVCGVVFILIALILTSILAARSIK